MNAKTIIFDIVLITAFGGIALNMRRLVEFQPLGRWVNRFDYPERRGASPPQAPITVE